MEPIQIRFDGGKIRLITPDYKTEIHGIPCYFYKSRFSNGDTGSYYVGGAYAAKYGAICSIGPSYEYHNCFTPESAVNVANEIINKISIKKFQELTKNPDLKIK